MKAKRKNITSRIVMGKNCLSELLEHAPERIIKVYAASHVRKLSGKRAHLVRSLQEKKIPIEFRDKRELSNLVNSDSHQSFVAFVQEKKNLDINYFLEKEKCFVLMLDSINDPQNLGALLRAAECFGVDAVVWSKNRGCDISPVACKASVGASELVQTVKVANLAETIKKFKKSGFECIVADYNPNAQKLYSFKFPDKVLMVVGSEGEGVQHLIKKNADKTIYIPMHGKINSLNVSQATSAILSFWKSG